MTIQTFSIVGRSADGGQVGVAVASKFLAVGAYVPAASVDGALATQALGNMELRTKGLELLAQGLSAQTVLEQFFVNDPQKGERQAGMVDAHGNAATFTGDDCMPWAGGRAENDPHGSFAVQGNMLAGPEVLDAMVAAWRLSTDKPLALRLTDALAAGQDAGGDPRGKQAAAVIVAGKAMGYGGLSDIAVDLRVDDHENPIGELRRLLDLHNLYFGQSPEDELLPLEGSVLQEITVQLQKAGFSSGNIAKDLYQWMGRENYEERWHDGKIDPVVLGVLRKQQ